jgi:hypothetical protein
VIFPKILRGLSQSPAISALAKNFPKVANFWKVDLRFMAILLENAQNTEGVLWILTPNFPKRKLLRNLAI